MRNSVRMRRTATERVAPDSLLLDGIEVQENAAEAEAAGEDPAEYHPLSLVQLHRQSQTQT